MWIGEGDCATLNLTKTTFERSWRAILCDNQCDCLYQGRNEIGSSIVRTQTEMIEIYALMIRGCAWAVCQDDVVIKTHYDGDRGT